MLLVQILKGETNKINLILVQDSTTRKAEELLRWTLLLRLELIGGLLVKKVDQGLPYSLLVLQIDLDSQMVDQTTLEKR